MAPKGFSSKVSTPLLASVTAANPPAALTFDLGLPDASDRTKNQNKNDDSTLYCNLLDFKKRAKQIMPLPLYEYIASGTDDEQTLAENRDAWKGWYLRPRVMVPVGGVSTAITLFGERLSFPVFTSPAGVQALADESLEGECATARACGRLGTMFGLSQHATRSIEDVARGAPNTLRWYQAYIMKDRALTLRLVKRAVKAGYKGIFVTVDSVRFGYREADARNGWDSLPAPHRLVNYDEQGASSTQDQTYNSKEHKSWDQNSEQMWEQNVTWDDIRWLKKEGCPNLPLIVKGIMTGEDAILAVEHGADGVFVSNHGGRGLDGCLASIDVLPEVVSALKKRGFNVPVLLDGGVTRGTDVLKALALGATAVGLGKMVFYSLACGGEEGVVKMLQMLKTETEAAMAICGCANVKDITENLVTRHPSGGRVVPYIRASL